METHNIEAIEFIEPIPCLPVYCTGVATAYVSNGQIHSVWFCQQPGVNGMEYVINLRTIIPLSALAAMREVADAAIKASRERVALPDGLAV